MAFIERWSLAPVPETLRPGAVHVWSIRLDRSASEVNELRDTLSADELDRASRFYFDRDRRRFICARGTLRQILGRYLDVDPVALSFSYGPHGKPALSRAEIGALSFNVSHSGDLALIAVAPGAIELGVDVEEGRSMPDRDDIARQCFAPSEIARLRAMPAAMREDAFYRCWTRKEAYLKALGDGLAKPLDSFEVTFGVDEPVELRVVGDQGESARWTLVALDPAPGFAAALVATRGIRKVECRSWTESYPLIADAVMSGAGKTL